MEKELQWAAKKGKKRETRGKKIFGGGRVRDGEERAACKVRATHEKGKKKLSYRCLKTSSRWGGGTVHLGKDPGKVAKRVRCLGAQR